MQATHGLSFNERACLRGEMHAWQPSMSMCGWFPVSVVGGVEQAMINWRYLGQRALTESFFVDSLHAQKPQQRQICQTPFSALDQLGELLAPTAFIFHVSRCGSTLLCQLLSALPSCVVLSEPPVIDSLLRFQCEHRHTVPQRVQALRKMIAALGQKRSSAEQHFFIKFDSWHIHHMRLLRQAFPETPCLFLYREPLAVIASHQRQRGPHMVPGMLHPQVLPMADVSFPDGDLDAYGMRVLQGIYQMGLECSEQLQLLNYKQLPDAVVNEVLLRYRVTYSAQQLAALQQRSGFHAKSGIPGFQGDTSIGTGLQHRLPHLFSAVSNIYEQLERARCRQMSR